jgi:hypothetical protein
VTDTSAHALPSHETFHGPGPGTDPATGLIPRSVIPPDGVVVVYRRADGTPFIKVRGVTPELDVVTPDMAAALIVEQVTVPTAGASERLAANAAARTVAMTGHSLMYGQDTIGGAGVAVNGAPQKRSSRPTPEQFQLQATFLSAGPVTVVNQGYPGDTSATSFTRWEGGTSGDIEFVSLASPGPDSIVLRSESGAVEVDAIEFHPVRGGNWTVGDGADTPKLTPLVFPPVGAAGTVRTTTGYEVAIDKLGGASLRANDGATKRDRRWIFQVTLGNLGGVVLAHTLDPASANGIGQGYRLLRIDGNFRLSVLEYGAAAVDTNVADVFPTATSTPVRCTIECAYTASDDTLKVFVDGVLRHTIAAPALTYLMPGVVASDMAGGTGSLVKPAL